MKKLLLCCVLFFFSKSILSQNNDWPEGSYEIRSLEREENVPSFSPNGSFKVLGKSRSQSVEIEHLATVHSPRIHSKTLQAVDVVSDLDDEYVFASYNHQGAVKYGALQLIEFDDDDDIFVSSELLFKKSDINSISVEPGRHKGFLYFAGTDEKGAFFSYVHYRRGKFKSLGPKIYLPGYVVTDLTAGEDHLVVTTGDNGGVYVFPYDDPYWSHEIYDARSALIHEDKGEIWVLSGGGAKVHRFGFSGELLGEIGLDGAKIPESKSTLNHGKKHTLATVGEEGLRILCDNSVVGALESVHVPGLPKSETVTNSAASSKDHLFTANGSAGLYIYHLEAQGKKKCCPVQISQEAYLRFEGSASTNHVAIEEDYIFVANGKEGVQILKLHEEKD